MSEIQEIAKLNIPYIIIGFITIVVASVFVIKLVDFVFERFGIEFKSKRQRREDHNLLIETVQRVEEINKNSIEHDKKLEKNLVSLSNSIIAIGNKLDDMQEKNDKSEMVRLKDRIAEAYRKYHKSGEWTKMEKEAFDGLIRDYENHGGKNSFVHDICEPESFIWKLKD